MNWIIRKLVKFFFNLKFRIKEPEMVEYWRKSSDPARARLRNAKDGSLEMEIKDEKYAFPGFPRGHILTGPLAGLKKKVKDMLFNQIFAEIDKMSQEMKHDVMPPERMPLAVRHIWETFEKLEHMEVTDDMKGRIKLIKKVLCFFLCEDDAYRFRAQMFLDLIDQKTVALTKQDLYYARAKYWKPDRYKKIGGKWFDAYDY